MGNQIAQPVVQSIPKANDRSPIAYHYLEQQINTIIDRLMSFNRSLAKASEKGLEL
jgi:hypothetical protein